MPNFKVRGFFRGYILCTRVNKVFNFHYNIVNFTQKSAVINTTFLLHLVVILEQHFLWQA